MEYKGRCINFELWYINEEQQDLTRIYHTLENLIKKDIDQAVEDKCNAVVGLLLYEGFLYKNNTEYYNLLRRVQEYGAKQGIKKFLLICGIAWDYQQELDHRNLNYTIIPFDYSANAMWQSYKQYALPSWNSNTSKFLFLGGVPSRNNRIGLLSKFYDDGMLNDNTALWSFFKPYNNEDQKECRQLLDHYTDEKYEKFLNDVESKVDNRYSDAKEYSKASGITWKDNEYLNTDFFQDPNYINPLIFTETSISVIAEGHVFPPARDFRFLTEKTWRAVINRHPFILADCDQRKDFAKHQGLDIFDDFFICDYDNSENLDGVVTNVKHFLNIKQDKESEIQEKINNNFLTFFNIINTNEEILTDLKNTFLLTDQEITKWFRQKSFDHLFRIPDYIE